MNAFYRVPIAAPVLPPRPRNKNPLLLLAAGLTAFLLFPIATSAQQVKIVKQDYHIDAVDPGIKLFVRSKMAQGTKKFTDENIVVFIHGATYPSTPDFDLRYQDYSWADWMVNQGYVVYMFDKRNYGYSTREKSDGRTGEEQ